MTDLPLKPERPLDSDCCGQGCDPCVLDLYVEELKIWEEECKLINNGEVKKVKANSEDVDVSGPVLSQTEYRKFTIESVIQETHDSYRFQFVLPPGKTLGLKTGQHVVIRGLVNGEVITRQYTPISDVTTKSQFVLLIKLYNEGCMSQYIREWKAGTMVDIRGPSGNFVYKPNKYMKLIMLVVGTGIAPMSQVIQTVLNNEDDMTIVELLYGCKTYEDILLKSEIDEWSHYWNFSCTFYLTQENKVDTSYRYGDKVIQGRITEDSVQAVLQNTCDKTLVLICGTKSFEQDMLRYVKHTGLTDEHYHKF